MRPVACPSSQEKINENVARTIAFLVVVILLAGIYLKSPLVFMALAADFCLRAFTKGKYSPLKYISKNITGYFHIRERMTDAAPKKFAAALGLLFSAAIAACLWMHYDFCADVLTSIILICAGLECFVAFCLGCIIYTYVVLPFLSKENPEESGISINL